MRRTNIPQVHDDALPAGLTEPASCLRRLSELPKHIPPGRDGKRRHTSTIYRYVFRGVRGIRLEAWRLPDGWYSSPSAWARFVERLTAALRAAPALPRNLPTRSSTNRQSAVEAEIEAVRASIGRKAASGGREDLQASAALKPRWDGQRGELWFGDRLCKRFGQQAKDEKIILAAFEQAGWPARIDDPFPRDRDTDPHQRLADTARRLNQQNSSLRFEVEDTSLAIVWAPRDCGLRQPRDRR